MREKETDTGPYGTVSVSFFLPHQCHNPTEQHRESHAKKNKIHVYDHSLVTVVLITPIVMSCCTSCMT
jgi:hypothetical protein